MAETGFPDLSRVPGTVLVVGGTGMLAPAVDELLRSGRTVVLVARRASRFERRSAATGSLVAVDADWEQPELFADAVRRAASGRHLGAALLWVHLLHRDLVVRGLGDLLPAGAVVVRLWGTGGGRPIEEARASVRLTGRSMREVFLGKMTEPEGRRWLTHEEISAGALRALAGEETNRVIGELLAH